MREKAELFMEGWRAKLWLVYQDARTRDFLLLAQEIDVLSVKEEKYRESMVAKAFVEAVVDKGVRRKLRQKDPRTINETVRHAQMKGACNVLRGLLIWAYLPKTWSGGVATIKWLQEINCSAE